MWEGIHDEIQQRTGEIGTFRRRRRTIVLTRLRIVEKHVQILAGKGWPTITSSSRAGTPTTK